MMWVTQPRNRFLCSSISEPIKPLVVLHSDDIFYYMCSAKTLASRSHSLQQALVYLWLLNGWYCSVEYPLPKFEIRTCRFDTHSCSWHGSIMFNTLTNQRLLIHVTPNSTFTCLSFALVVCNIGLELIIISTIACREHGGRASSSSISNLSKLQT